MRQLENRQVIWLIAGEPSGDLYGARLAAELRRLAPEIELQGMGGGAMRRAGVEILVDSSNLAVVGLAEVVKNLFKFYRIFGYLRKRARLVRPVTVVLIDYPGFNLRFAAALWREGIPVVYYVSPQVWAWGRRRIAKLACYVRKMLVLFPFELEVFEGSGLDLEFVGHPLVEILEEERRLELVRESSKVLLLPGSRDNEIRRLLPDMLATVALLHCRQPQLRFVIALYDPGMEPSVYRQMKLSSDRLGIDFFAFTEVVSGQTRFWLQRAAAGIAASGTVTMEAAILGLPLAVVYRLHPLTYMIARHLVKVPYIAMPNLVAGECVYEEFIQQDFKPAAVARAVAAILPGGQREPEVKAGMVKVVAQLGAGAQTSRRTAEAVLAALS